PYYFAFGDEPKLVENSVLAAMLLSGLFGAVLSASSSLSRELRTGTALAVLSKPVGRIQFLLAKYAGLMAALTVLTYINTVGILLASRMAFDAYGKTDTGAIEIFCAGIAAAYALGGFSNFFLRRPFVSDAVLAMIGFCTLAAFIIFRYTTQVESLGTMGHVNWNVLPAAILILFALWILAAIALACSTRFDTIPTLSICSAIFLLGLMSDYFFGRRAEHGEWWASTLYSMIPNWQLFWIADAIDRGKSTYDWSYVGKALAYAVFYTGAALAAGAALFEDRELS
ncbi:MAG: ABC transporter permease, partial [Limisphaerales bacterium]